MVDPYFQLITAVLTRGRMTNSYKPALLRALAEHGRVNPAESVVEWPWLAERFLEYYWPLATRYRIRQATDPSRDPVVMRLIRELSLAPRTTFTQFRRRSPALIRALIARLSHPGTECCLDEVVPRFHQVGGNPPAMLYSYQNVGDPLMLSSSSLEFLTGNYEVLRLLAIGRWVRFTEQYSSAPRLYEKIQNAAKRKPLARQGRALQQVGEAVTCFYCNAVLEDNVEIDHFIPWSFVVEDKLWNLVVSCSDCNSKKSDGIALYFLDSLFERNRRLALIIEEDAAPPALARDLKPWELSSLEQHLALLCDNAVAEGFSIWR